MDFGFMERPNRAETQVPTVHDQHDAIVERLKQNSRTPWLDYLPLAHCALGGGAITATIGASVGYLRISAWWTVGVCAALLLLTLIMDFTYQAGRGQRGK